MKSLVLFALFAALGLPHTAHSQSLADVAKKTQEARAKKTAEEPVKGHTTDKGDPADKTGKIDKTDKAPTKTYTNKDLAPVPPPVVVAPATPGAPPDVAASTTDPRTEPYWRERRRVIDAKIHDDQMKSKAAGELVSLMRKTGIMRRDPAAWLAALNDEKRWSDAVHYDVVHLVPDFYAEGKRAGVPEAWLRPSDR